ncbi:MAG: hypothetical protein KJ804_00345 [Proteobacteria bacterium]|nr:hypothetical protein [Pseudomonadota bacterium]MBU1056755.1 hypothetical protein [Pseudomonadota bacterium]
MVLVMLLAMMSVSACANSDRGNRGGQQGPPPEAIKACEGKQEGDKVTFEGRGGESLSGTCQSVDDQLAAVPEGHRSPQ